MNEHIPDQTLDPADWDEFSKLSHQILDDMVDYLRYIERKPVWQAMPDSVKASFNEPLPLSGKSMSEVYEDFNHRILPYAKGNAHPRYWAWVEGNGTPWGAVADMMASFINTNVSFGEFAAMYVDKQVISWCKEMMKYPNTASGILVSGGSMANTVALAVARNQQAASLNLRESGMVAMKKKMILYCSTETHYCVQKAVEVIGLGAASMQKISVNADYQIDLDELAERISRDKDEGNLPFCIVGNAGTVNTGAIDDLKALRELADIHGLWLHVDGAFGALAKMTPEFCEELIAIEQSDSVAFDLHKWLSLPYDIGCCLIRDGEAHKNTFNVNVGYLQHHERGLASGPEPTRSYGIELSRDFKALKAWMCFKTYGLEKHISMIEQNIAQAKYTKGLIERQRCLQLMAPVKLNIVCFRFYTTELSDENLNWLNKEIVIRLQETGIASISSAILNNCYSMRIAIVNHRSKMSDFDLLIESCVSLGSEILNTLQINS